MNLKRPINVFATEIPEAGRKRSVTSEVLEKSNPNSHASMLSADSGKEGMIYIGGEIECSGLILKRKHRLLSEKSMT